MNDQKVAEPVRQISLVKKCSLSLAQIIRMQHCLWYIPVHLKYREDHQHLKIKAVNAFPCSLLINVLHSVDIISIFEVRSQGEIPILEITIPMSVDFHSTYSSLSWSLTDEGVNHPCSIGPTPEGLNFLCGLFLGEKGESIDLMKVFLPCSFSIGYLKAFVRILLKHYFM